MITLKQGIKISAIIDKLELKITDPNGNAEKVGSDLMMQAIGKAHKAESEIYDLISDIKKITPQEAENIDLIEFIKGIAKDTGAMAFFKSAAMSKMQG